MSYPPNAISVFSSRGPTLWFDVKPDIAAPGAFIKSACAADPGNCNGNAYVEYSGTSMASPMVTGAVALLIQQARQIGVELSLQDIKSRLLNSTEVVQKLEGQPGKVATIFEQGAGLMQIDRALKSVLHISPANVSFGLVEYNQKSVESILHVTNSGDQTKHVQLDWYFKDENTHFDHAVSITPAELTVGPGETQDVVLSIDLSSMPSSKNYRKMAGRIFASDFGQIVSHSIFGLVHEAEKTTLDLELIGPDGPGTPLHFSHVRVYDAQNSEGYRNSWPLEPDMPPPGESSMQFRVPVDCIYNVTFSTAQAIPPGTPGAGSYQVNHYELAVGRTPVKVTLDASKAKPVALDFKADPNFDIQKTTYDYVKAYKRSDGTVVFSGGNGFGYAGYNIYNNRQPTLGSLRVFNRWSSKGTPTPEGDEVWYHWTENADGDEPRTITVTKTDLNTSAVATIQSYSQLPVVGNIEWMSCPTDVEHFKGTCTDFLFFPQANAPMPVNRKEYFKPFDAGYKIYWSPEWAFGSMYHFQDSHTNQIQGKEIQGRIWKPNQQAVLRLGQRSAKPNLSLVSRKKELLEIYGVPLMDPIGLTGMPMVPWKDGFEVEVFVDGEKVVEYKPDFVGGLHVDLPPFYHSHVDVHMQAMTSPSWFDHPVTTSSTISFFTSPWKQGEMAIPQTTYVVDNLKRNNKVACSGGRRCQISFKIQFNSTSGNLGLMYAMADLSTDGGKTWVFPDRSFMAHKTLYVQSKIPMAQQQTEMPVSIRLYALTYDGVVIDETVHNAILIEKPTRTKAN